VVKNDQQEIDIYLLGICKRAMKHVKQEPETKMLTLEEYIALLLGDPFRRDTLNSSGTSEKQGIL